MALCPNACDDVTLVQNPETSCTTSKRMLIPNRFMFYPCSVDLPSPIQGNIAPLFEDGTIVATSSLRNFTLNDPTTQDLSLTDCDPAFRLVTGREITFQDTIAISYPSGSPATYNEYWDYYFWLDKIQNQLKVRVMIAYCNGDVRIPIDENGDPLTVTLHGFINYDAAGVAGGKRLEFKQFSMLFNGDPLAFNVVPAFNYIEEGIVI